MVDSETCPRASRGSSSAASVRPVNLAPGLEQRHNRGPFGRQQITAANPTRSDLAGAGGSAVELHRQRAQVRPQLLVTGQAT